MRLYYLADGKILKIARVIDALPEDSPKTAINVPYSILELDEEYNRVTCFLLIRNNRGTPEHPMPDRLSVNGLGQLINNDTLAVVTINPNPNKEAFKRIEHMTASKDPGRYTIRVTLRYNDINAQQSAVFEIR